MWSILSHISSKVLAFSSRMARSSSAASLFLLISCFCLSESCIHLALRPSYLPSLPDPLNPPPGPGALGDAHAGDDTEPTHTGLMGSRLGVDGPCPGGEDAGKPPPALPVDLVGEKIKSIGGDTMPGVPAMGIFIANLGLVEWSTRAVIAIGRQNLFLNPFLSRFECATDGRDIVEGA